LDGKNIDGVFEVFDMLASVYEWIDSWHNAEDYMKGASSLTGIRKRIKKE
jgi:hypothetical protein